VVKSQAMKSRYKKLDDFEKELKGEGVVENFKPLYVID